MIGKKIKDMLYSKIIYRLMIILQLLVANGVSIFSQQEPMYSQYIFNGLLINPAYAGTHDALSVTALYRKQWVNIPGAPQTATLSADAPVHNEKIGVGLNFLMDKIGIDKKTELMGIYSYKIKFEHGALSAGLQVGASFFSNNYSSVEYSNVAKNDVAFMQDFHRTVPYFGFGLYFYTEKFFAGLSIPQFAPRSLTDLINNNSSTAHFDQANHVFLNGGYVIDLNQDIKLKPSLLLKYVHGAPLELDVNGTFLFYNFFALGASYRSLSSVNLFGEIKVSSGFSLGYAYEYTTTDLQKFNSGTHEIMLRFDVGNSKSKVVTPRYF